MPRAQSRLRLLGYSYGLLLFIGFIDYATGYEVPIYPFYAVPILLVVWFADRRAAHAITLLSAGIWWWADVAAGHPYESHWLQAWDILSRLMFFYLVMLAGTAVRQQRDAIRARVALLEHSQQLEHEINRHQRARAPEHRARPARRHVPVPRGHRFQRRPPAPGPRPPRPAGG